MKDSELIEGSAKSDRRPTMREPIFLWSGDQFLEFFVVTGGTMLGLAGVRWLLTAVGL